MTRPYEERGKHGYATGAPLLLFAFISLASIGGACLIAADGRAHGQIDGVLLPIAMAAVSIALLIGVIAVFAWCRWGLWIIGAWVYLTIVFGIVDSVHDGLDWRVLIGLAGLAILYDDLRRAVRRRLADGRLPGT